MKKCKATFVTVEYLIQMCRTREKIFGDVYVLQPRGERIIIGHYSHVLGRSVAADADSNLRERRKEAGKALVLAV